MTGLMDLPTLWLAVAETARRQGSLPCLAIPPRPSRDYDPDGLLWDLRRGRRARDTPLDRACLCRLRPRASRLAGAREPARVHAALPGASQCAGMLGGAAQSGVPARRPHLCPRPQVDVIVALPQHTAAMIAAGQALDIASRSSPPRRSPTRSSRTRPARAAPPGRASESVLMYTSGTTGLPKWPC